MSLKLNWTSHKLGTDEKSVWFGNFTLYALRVKNKSGNKEWQVTWYEVSENTLRRVSTRAVPGLTDKRFTSLASAQYAAERYFLPFLKLVPQLIQTDTKTTVYQSAFRST